MFNLHYIASLHDPDGVLTLHRKVSIRDAPQRKKLSHDGRDGGRRVRDGAEGSRHLQEGRRGGRREKIIRVTVAHETLDGVTERVDDDTGGGVRAEGGLLVAKLLVHLVVTLIQRLHQNGDTIKPQGQIGRGPRGNAGTRAITEHENEGVDISTDTRKLNPLVGTGRHTRSRTNNGPLCR